MALVTLAQVKEHCRIDHSLEDSVLAIYMAAAENWISNYLNQPIIPQKDAVKAAALLIISDLYENRSAKLERDYKPNSAIDMLLYPYRVDLGI